MDYEAKVDPEALLFTKSVGTRSRESDDHKRLAAIAALRKPQWGPGTPWKDEEEWSRAWERTEARERREYSAAFGLQSRPRHMPCADAMAAYMQAVHVGMELDEAYNLTALMVDEMQARRARGHGRRIPAEPFVDVRELFLLEPDLRAQAVELANMARDWADVQGVLEAQLEACLKRRGTEISEEEVEVEEEEEPPSEMRAWLSGRE